MTEPTDESVEVEGRTVAFSQYGAPDGVPCLHMHGGPSSRLEGVLFASAAERAGVRLIVVDRPGIGLSDDDADRTLAGWAATVGAFADVLGLERFAVTGWSEGGPSAVACAAGLSDRLTLVVNVAGASYGALDPKGTLRELSTQDRAGGELALHAAHGLRAMYAMLGVLAVHEPQQYLKTLLKTLGEADRAVLADRAVADAFLVASAECFRQGSGGLTHDALLLYHHWNIDLGAITTPLQTWQATGDTLVPAIISEQLMAAIPNGVYRTFPGEGHFISVSHSDELMETVRSAAE